MVTCKFRIVGFVCEACVRLAKMKIEEIEGVEKVETDTSGDTQIVANHKISTDELLKVFKGSNYKILEG